MSSEDDIDNELAKIEEEIKQYESNPTSISSPTMPDKNKDNIFIFARELIKSTDTRKFGFLDQKHIGNPKMTINDYLEIADYCDIEGMQPLGKVFRDEAENILSTSLSNKGFLLKILVTQIKKEQKMPVNPTAQKSSFWNKNKEVKDDEQV
jgi:hypothetical protein